MIKIRRFIAQGLFMLADLFEWLGAMVWIEDPNIDLFPGMTDKERQTLKNKFFELNDE